MPSFEQLKSKHRDEIASLNDTSEMSEGLYQDFYEYFLSNGDMPYGVAKARTGDPYEFVFQKLT